MRVLAILILLIAGTTVPSGADPIVDACARDDAKLVAECPRMCTSACRDPRSRSMRDACRGISAISEARRVDGPKCEQLARITPDRCSAFVSSSADDGIPDSGEAPPPCMRSFPHLRCRFEQLAEDFGALVTRFTPMVSRYRPLLEQVRPDQDPDEIEKLLCGVSLQDMAIDFRTSEALNAEASKLKADFDEQSKCVVKIDDWIKNYKCVSKVDCGNIGDSIIKGFRRRIEPALTTRGRVETLIANVEQSRNVIIDTRRLHRAVCEPIRR